MRIRTICSIALSVLLLNFSSPAFAVPSKEPSWIQESPRLLLGPVVRLSKEEEVNYFNIENRCIKDVEKTMGDYLNEKASSKESPQWMLQESDGTTRVVDSNEFASNAVMQCLDERSSGDPFIQRYLHPSHIFQDSW